MKVAGDSRIKEASISAVVIRADGTREEVGTIAYWHVNLLKRLMFWLRKKLNKPA